MALTRFLIFIVTINALGSGEGLAQPSSLCTRCPDASVASDDDPALKITATTKRPCQHAGIPLGYIQSSLLLPVPSLPAFSIPRSEPSKPKHAYSTYYSGLSPPAILA